MIQDYNNESHQNIAVPPTCSFVLPCVNAFASSCKQNLLYETFTVPLNCPWQVGNPVCAHGQLSEYESLSKRRHGDQNSSWSLAPPAEQSVQQPILLVKSSMSLFTGLQARLQNGVLYRMKTISLLCYIKHVDRKCSSDQRTCFKTSLFIWSHPADNVETPVQAFNRW